MDMLDAVRVEFTVKLFVVPDDKVRAPPDNEIMDAVSALRE
jgi:hypothetical protein